MRGSGAFLDWTNRARAVPIGEEILRRGINNLKRIGGEYVGPCPKCGGDDRFAVHIQKNIFNCRGCGIGGDVIQLVEHLDGVDFKAACATLAGPQPKANGRDRPGGAGTGEAGTVVAEFQYDDRDGTAVLKVERIEFQKFDGGGFVLEGGKRKKTFRQKRPDPNNRGKWIPNADGVAVVPYRLPQLLEAIAAGYPILIVEGEAKVDLLWSWNIAATCCVGGAKKWREEHSEYLRGADVYLLPDNDNAGWEHIHKVGGSLSTIAKSIRVVTLPDLPPKGDIVDWARAGGTREKLDALLAAAPAWTLPTAEDRAAAAKAAEGGDGGADLLRAFAFLNEAPAAPQAMLIEGVLPLEGLPFIGGQSSAGKTFIAILMAACAATQKPFFGHEVTERVGSVIVAAEGKAMLRSRLLAALKELGVGEDIEVPIAWVREIPDFSNRHGVAAFIEKLQAVSEHFKEKFDVRLGLVFVDTVSASFDIEEEADNAEASRVCKIMRRISETASAIVVPIHHYGKNAAVGLRGASAWRANADIVLSVTADIDPMTGIVGNRQLSMAKDRDGAQGPLTAFMLKPVELGIDETGKPFGSMVAVATESIQPASEWPEHLRILRQALSTAIIEHGSDERPFPDGPQVRAVAEAKVREEFERIAHVDSSPEKRQEALRKQFSRKLNGAQAKGLVGVCMFTAGHGLVWFLSRKEGSNPGPDTKSVSLGG